MKKLLIILAAVFVSTLAMAQTTTKNYVKSTSYQQPVQNEAEIAALPLLDKYETITYYDGLGRPEQSIALRQGGVLNPNNELTYDWKIGNVNSTNSVFTKLGSEQENEIINGITPFGNTDLLWKCGSDVTTGADGGWMTNIISVDKTVGYRYTTWVKRTGSTTDGSTHHGPYYVNNLDGTENSNPYFWLGNLPEVDTWYLLVGVVHPYNYTGGDSGESGLYDIEGNKLASGTDFKWKSTTTIGRFRNYLWSSTDLNTYQYFYKPLLQRLDGQELSLAQINNTFVKDIITPVVYDPYGRQTKEYLPYADLTLGNYTPNEQIAIPSINNYYNTNYSEDLDVTPNPYSEKHLEASPLSRILEQGAPGADWKVDPTADTDHTIKFEYETNLANEVPYYTVIFPTTKTEEPQLYYNGTYAENQLYKSITKDENWSPTQTYLKNHTTEEFKNKQGQVVLKRTYTDNGSEAVAHDTQYVYDDYGNLTYVISPKGSDLVLYNNNYPNYSNTYAYTQLVGTNSKGVPNTFGSGTFNVSVDATAKTISLNFNVSFNNPTELKLGPAVLLNQTIPNVILGAIQGSGYNYTLSVQNGYIYIAGSGQLSSINTSMSVNLPSQSINTDVVDALGYQYHYDYRNRLIEKKIPGKAWEYIVYDKLDRPVLTQDANQRINNKWLFTKYDDYNRVIYTGQHTFTPTGVNDNSGRAELQEAVNLQGSFNENKLNTPFTIGDTALYYSNKVIPNSNIEVYTVNYYDTYPQDIATVIPDIGTFNLAGQTYTTTSNTTSLATGSRVRVLGTNQWITSATYYDAKARPIYIASHNSYLNTTDKVKTALDFVGKTLETESKHIKNGITITTNDAFTYDHASRLVTQSQTINNGTPELIVNNSYDDLGQLINKKVGGAVANTANTSSGLQSVDYKYNIRGWLRQINDVDNLGNDLFGFKLGYNTPQTGATPLYNGNISETLWKTNNQDDTNRAYSYTYDALNRIENATYKIHVFGQYVIPQYEYTLNNVDYDKNGNILALSRQGATGEYTIDQLIYTYDIGNKLMEVKDIYGANPKGFNDGNTTGDDYTYDANGNMVKDLNKDIGVAGENGAQGITYNHLNLPTSITFNNDATKTISYIYDATGAKQAKVVTNGSSLTTTKYAGNFIYEETSAGEVLKFFNHPEGYIQPDNTGGFEYIYQYKDHLGNIRLSYGDIDGDGIIDIAEDTNNDGVFDTDIDGDGDLDNEIIEENNYYPFGLKHEGYNYNITSTNPALDFKYNGTELNTDFDINLYEMPLRQYDAAIARFTSVDPVTHHEFSTYSAFDNNPIYWADPSGADAIDHANGTLYTGMEARDMVRQMQSQIRSDSSEENENSDCCNGAGDNGKSMIEGNTLDEIVITGNTKRVEDLMSRGYTREDINYRNLLEKNNKYYFNIIRRLEQRGIYRSFHPTDFSDFKSNFNAGWNNWDEDGIGNAWMNIAAGGIGGTMSLTVASVGGTGVTLTGTRSLVGGVTNTVSGFGEYAYAYVNIHGNALYSSSMTAFGRSYVRYTPKLIRRQLFNKGMYRQFNNPSFIDFSKYFSKYTTKIIEKGLKGLD